MNKALFLDRDGVLNRERGAYTFKKQDFEVLSSVAQAIRSANDKGYLVIVVSNQGGIAKGLYTKNEVLELHQLLLDDIAGSGAEITAYYFCPHHDEIGKCLCRKPGSLLLEKAMARFNVHAGSSFFIGDSERDMEAARAVGVEGILVESNGNLLKVVEQIL